MAKKFGFQVFDGEWIYYKDLTEDRPLEYMGPPMSAKLSLGIQEENKTTPFPF